MEANPNEKVRKLAEEALKRLSDELAAGRSETLTKYLAAMGHFRRYSWGNVLLITSQRPEATHVAGFHTWRDLGRFVKKGERGIMIFAPVVVKQHGREGSAPEPDNPQATFRLAGFRAAYIFDVTQTEGRPLPQFAVTSGDPKDHAERLRDVARQQGISVEYDRAIAPALGVSSGGRIRLLPGLAKAEEFSVLTHELAHEMLHQKKDTDYPPVIRETQAEAVAFVVCRGIGLETNSAAADYIRLYNGDQATLAKSLAVIQETSARILDQLMPEMRHADGARSSDEQTGETQDLPRPSSNDRSSPSGPSDPGQSPVWDR
jgi:antirestriction protein ArdC